MAGSLLRMLRWTVSGRRRVTQTAKRRMLRLRVESLEARRLLHGAGTLGDEHEAVMALIDFGEIHRTASNPVYYVAQDGDANAATANLWSNLSNWLKET